MGTLWPNKINSIVDQDETTPSRDESPHTNVSVVEFKGFQDSYVERMLLRNNSD